MDNYEARVAALEARIQELEAINEARALRPAFSWKGWLEKYGLLLVWIAIILILGAFKPAQMFSWNAYATMFGSNAMVVVLTLALIIPLTTGDFDLSVAATMGLSSMIIAVMNVQLNQPIFISIVAALLAGASVGVINAFFIVYFRVFSLIVTLGTGYFVAGLILWVSDSGTIAGISMGLVEAVILTRFLGVPLGFYYALILTVAIWYLFQYTALGRRALFVGRCAVARLSGVNVNSIRSGRSSPLPCWRPLRVCSTQGCAALRIPLRLWLFCCPHSLPPF